MMASERPESQSPKDQQPASPADPLAPPDQPINLDQAPDGPPIQITLEPARPASQGRMTPVPFFLKFDVLLAAAVITLGFAVASFTVRNSDFWMHMATGRAIAQGKYEFGKAPFTYSGVDRNYVNHSWVYDLVYYQIFDKMGPHAVVAIKAALIALLAAFLLAIRRPGQSLWMGAFMIALALIASAPRLIMQPSIFSFLFLGITVYLLVQRSANATSWKLPLAIGVLFCLWANTDQWFFLGPIAVALCLLGEFLQTLLKRPRALDTGPEELERKPLKPLGLALVVGVLACMVNPAHVHIWQLPPEFMAKQLGTPLGKTYAFEKNNAFLGLIQTSFEKGALFGGGPTRNPVNSVAILLLLILNILSILVNVIAGGRTRLGFHFINLGMFGIAVLHHRAIPFYAIVAAPCTAMTLGEAVARMRERTYSLSTLQIFGAVRVGCRMLVLIVMGISLAAAWPGWLNTFQAADQRRMAWDVQPDASSQKTALMLQKWRDEHKLLPEARTLIIDPDLSNYCAWFAPSEKAYFDTRFDFHGPEVESYIKLSQILNSVVNDPTKKIDFNLPKFLQEQKITHVVLSSDLGIIKMLGTNAIRVEWQLWGLSGRSSVFGWTKQEVMPEPQFQAMLFSPSEAAFGPEAVQVPDPSTIRPPEKRDEFLVKFLTPRPTHPHQADMSANLLVFEDYKQFRNGRARDFVQALNWMQILRYAPYSPPMMLRVPELPPDRDVTACALLAIREGRRAILEQPDHPAGYRALANAYYSPSFMTTPENRHLVVVSTLERYLARLTPEQQALDFGNADQATRRLVKEHLSEQNPRAEHRYDLALQAARKTVEILRYNIDRAVTPEVAKELRNQLNGAGNAVLKLENQVRSKENVWLNKSARLPGPFERAISAQLDGLFLRSLEELQKLDLGDSSKLSANEQFFAFTQLIYLYLLTGQAELADQKLAELEARTIDFREERRRMGDMRFELLIRDREFQVALVLGRFSKAIENQRHRLDETMDQLGHLPMSVLERTGARAVAARFGYPLSMNWLAATVAAYGDAENMVLAYDVLASRAETYNLQLGTLYLEQGDVRSAATRFEEVVKLRPKVRTPAQISAETYLKMFRQP